MTGSFRPRGASESPIPGSHAEPAPILQWVGLLLPAATFFAHLQVAYVLVPWTCTTGQHVWNHVAGMIAVAISALGCVAAWRTWMRAGRDVPGEGSGSLPRTRMLGACGLGMGAVFTLILSAQWIAAFAISPCQ